MDQPTNLEITIKGNKLDVKRAAIAANRRIERDTRGFDENEYVFNEESFDDQIEEIYEILGSYEINQIEANEWEFKAEQDSYGCTEENDIKEIAEEIVRSSPNVEFHISAVITTCYEDGYDLCVDVDFVNGEMNVNTFKDYFDDEEDDDEEEDDEEDF